MALSVYGLLTVAWFFYRCATQNFEGKFTDRTITIHTVRITISPPPPPPCLPFAEDLLCVILLSHSQYVNPPTLCVCVCVCVCVCRL